MDTQPIARSARLEAADHPPPGGAAEATARACLKGDGLAVIVLLLGIVAAVVVFLPPEGWVAVVLHDLVDQLLGRAGFLLPVALLVGGATVLLHGLAPDVPLPLSRLAGVGLIALAVLPAEHLLAASLGDGSGLVGLWLGSALLRWLGGPLTGVVLALALVGGTLLAFDVGLSQVTGGLRRANSRVRRAVSRRSRAAASALPPVSASRRLLATKRPAPAWRPRPPEASAPSEPEAGGGTAPDEAVADGAAAANPQSVVARRETSRTSQPARERDGGPPAREPPAPPDGPATRHPDPPPAAPGAQAWRLPAASLFQSGAVEPANPQDLEARSRLIEQTLATFNVEARVVEANQGPTVTQFGIEPGPGVAISRILSRQNDLALRLGTSPIRLEAPVPGKRMVGLEVPNGTVATVALRDVVDSTEWRGGDAALRLALGRDVSGTAVVADLARMPHLLIAGATGSGKSVCINTIVASLLHQLAPDRLQLLMIDPKRVELTGFADIPHLRLPVVTETDTVVGVLKWVVIEMDRRYKLFAEHAARNLDGYNRRVAAGASGGGLALPYLVVVIDELADLMMTAAEDVERTLCRLAQLARATGIHLVVATQRPSVDVITGLIKANFPTRLAFAVSSQTDSRVILDQAGAERLLGRGDALFMATDAMKPVRLQGAFVSDDEIQALVAHWTSQGAPSYTPDELEQVKALALGEEEDDDVYERAVELAETVGRLSASLLQRRLGIGQARAQRLLARLVEDGVAEP